MSAPSPSPAPSEHPSEHPSGGGGTGLPAPVEPVKVPAIVRFTALMNREPAKTLWTLYLRAVGAQAVHFFTRHVLRVHGLEHLRAVSPERPLLLVANHRSFYDMYVVSSVLLRKVPGPWRIFFPVRGRYCYQSTGGALLNCLAAGWSMYPPFFREAGTRELDRVMLDRLAALLREGRGHVVGFHPEGTRNKGDDPWALLPPHPGVGQLVLQTRPQIVPVFVAGLANDPRAQLRANRPGGAPVRVRFGAPLPADAYDGVPMRTRGYVEVAQDLMRRIAALAEEDRREMQGG